MEQILTLTFNPTVDVSSEADMLCSIHKIRTTRESFHPGGGGINVARVIDSLGGQVTALYVRGGVMGAVLDHLLKTCGIHRRIVKIDGNTRINNIIHENRTGLEYRFITEGPSLIEAEWQSCVKMCSEMPWKWLVVSGSLPPGVPVIVYDQIFKNAHKEKRFLVVDTSGKGLYHILNHGGATLVKPSQREFETSMQRTYSSVAEIAEAAQDLVRKEISKIITITLGQHGAILATADTMLYLAAPPVDFASASGAGDSFIGGMVYALAKKKTLTDAFRLGVACGSATVMEKGTGLCNPENVCKLFDTLSPVHANEVDLPLNST